ncbi:hypothetical protein HDV06_001257 [Boothiomyces sp. JEL0866]|nr:hypothetical protein HDV06_001257 [Boothiomyces sp. JEL0866]
MPTVLNGKIPDEIGQLSQLNLLHLFQNDLGGTLPSSISKLSLLTDLSLGGNGIKGSIPTEYGNLNKLSVLYLDSNQLTGTIPDSLGKLPSITILSMHDNKLSGPLPSSLKTLSANTTPQFTCDDSVRNSVTVANTTVNVGPTTTGTSNNGSGNQLDSSGSSQSSGLIIGVTVGVAICLVLAISLFLFWRNSYRKKPKRNSDTIKESPVIVTPVQERASYELPLPAQTQNDFYKELPETYPKTDSFYNNRNTFLDMNPYSDGDTVLMDPYNKRSTPQYEAYKRDTYDEQRRSRPYYPDDSFDAHIEKKLNEDFRGSKLDPHDRNFNSFQNSNYDEGLARDQARFKLPDTPQDRPFSTLFTPILEPIDAESTTSRQPPILLHPRQNQNRPY